MVKMHNNKGDKLCALQKHLPSVASYFRPEEVAGMFWLLFLRAEWSDKWMKGQADYWERMSCCVGMPKSDQDRDVGGQRFQ